MKMAWFGVEEWLNPMDSKAKVNLGSSCVSAIKLNELFDLIGQVLMWAALVLTLISLFDYLWKNKTVLYDVH